MNEDKKYQLTLTEAQASILTRALDAYVRTGLGQLEHALDVYDREGKLGIYARDQILSGLEAAKLAAGHPVNGSFGIFSPSVSDEFRAAFDINQVVRHRLAWDRNPEGGIQVDFGEPTQCSKQAVPKIETK